MRRSAKLFGVGLLLTGLGCASSYEGGEGYDLAPAEEVAGPDVREGGLTDVLPWTGQTAEAAIAVVGRRESPRNLRVNNRVIVWTEHSRTGASAVSVLDKATGDLAYLDTGGSLPWSAAFDGREVFWADPIDAGVLWSMDPEVHVPVKVGAPDGAALVAADRDGPVWANFDGTIWKRDPGTGFVDRIASGPGVPQVVVVDAERVYWVSGAAGKLFSVVREGGVAKELADVGSDVTQLGFVGEGIAWLDPVKGQVFAIPRAGGDVVALATGLAETGAAAFDADAVWVQAGVQGDRLLRVALDGSGVTTHTRGLGGVTELATDGAFVYAIDADGRIVALRR